MEVMEGGEEGWNYWEIGPWKFERPVRGAGVWGRLNDVEANNQDDKNR